jgi:hypothetical protein
MAKRPALSIEPEYRSRLEKKVGEQLRAAGVKAGYETLKLEFHVPARTAKYTPDFVCGPIILETKGYFYDGARDRQRLVQVKESHPTLDLRIIFQNANKPIYKGSKTTYAKWATDHGIPWADGGVVPPKWMAEILAAQ